jgi:hypothetical protein
MPSHRVKLIETLKSLCARHGLTWDEQLADDVPRKWRIHTDIVLLPSLRSFVDPRWTRDIRACLSRVLFTRQSIVVALVQRRTNCGRALLVRSARR